MIRVTILLLLCFPVSPTWANSLTAQEVPTESAFSHQWQLLRDGLIHDGSFEEGTCQDGQSTWTCAADNDCDWIVDLVPLGLWNYDGMHVAWLGGFCGGQATCYTEICQELLLDGDTLTFYWMAYVSNAVMEWGVSVDGTQIFQRPIFFTDHMLDYQPWSIDIPAEYVGGTHTLCFVGDNQEFCQENWGDNWFIDYVELWLLTAVPPAELLPFSLSTVKTLY